MSERDREERSTEARQRSQGAKEEHRGEAEGCSPRFRAEHQSTAKKEWDRSRGAPTPRTGAERQPLNAAADSPNPPSSIFEVAEVVENREVSFGGSVDAIN